VLPSCNQWRRSERHQEPILPMMTPDHRPDGQIFRE